MFAIVEIVGFQEKVEEGQKLRVPTVDATEGQKVMFEKVLLLAKSGDDVTIGNPYVAGASIEVKVLGHGRDEKIDIRKMRRRKRYRRHRGHRQGFTEVEVVKITA